MKGRVYVHGSWDDIEVDFHTMVIHYCGKQINIERAESIINLMGEYKQRGHFIEHIEIKPPQHIKNFSFK
jgi:pentatricopeptide repeat protein